MNTNLTILLCAVAAAISVAASNPVEQPQQPPSPSYVYRAVVTKVKDGDTVEVNIDLGFGVWKHKETLRLLEVFAPETFRPSTPKEKEDGNKVKSFLTAKLPVGKSIVIETHKDGKDKYGRYLAVLWDDDGNVNHSILNFMKANSINPNK